MKSFYITPILLFLCLRLWCQDCSAFNFTYTTTESRCMATGSIIVNVTGGSGNYSFKVTGPITPPVTSSNVITGLPTGYYSILVKDNNYGCTKQLDSAFITGNYSDPRFQLTKTDASCSGHDGSIATINQIFGRSPFSYTIISPSPGSVGQTNTSGSFNNLVPGEYYVQLTDSCGGIQVRRVTVDQFVWTFDIVNIAPLGCDSASVFIQLKSNNGVTNTSGNPAFNGFTYGIVRSAGDTSWFGNNNFHVYTAKQKHLVVVVKDACGNIFTTNWYFPASLVPKAGPVLFSNFNCATFAATVSAQQNLTSPVFYLTDNLGNPITSNNTGIFPMLNYGSYCINVVNQCYDTTIKLCFSVAHAIPSLGATVQINNQNCNSFTATVTGQANLTNPYYCLYDAANTLVSCDSTGIFGNLSYGSYCIKMHDGCIDTTIIRCFTVSKPVPVLTSYNITGATCSGFSVSVSGNNLITPYYCLYDSLGNVVACDSSGIFTNIPLGHYCIRAVSCGGDSTNSICFTSAIPRPSLGPWVQLYNQTCTGMTAAINGQTNLTNPQYCLYNNNDSLLACNTTGIFDNVPYGSFCIKVHNSCYDTTISRCWTMLRAVPSVNATIQEYNTTCSSFSARVTGSNLSTPQFCLFDSLNNQISCNTTGIFDSLPYGSYCVTVHDGCTDTTMKVCQSLYMPRGLTLTATKSCTIGVSNISIKFTNNNAPYNIKVYHPNGTKLNDTTTSVNPLTLPLPALPVGIQYKIVGTDNCGQKDSSTVTPDAAIVTQSSTVRSKCPSGTSLNGSGDINASATSNLYPLTPVIIKKNGLDTIQNYSSVSGNVYTFSDLAPAQYIVEYTMQTCNSKIDDTVTVVPYAYPTQGQSAIYQCDNNGFSLGANVRGGVTPYSYQIIGSTPDTPSIVSAAQNSPVFNINTGTDYSLVRLRSIDACGNATLNDVSVLPLQNISIKASSNCYYQSITLTTDTIPTANYQWFRRTSLTDSVLIDSGLSHNLPFFVPEQSGQYIVRANINNGCVTRLSYFTLSGNCNIVLPVTLKLQGKSTNAGNQLFWDNSADANVISYTLERKTVHDAGFTSIGLIRDKDQKQHVFVDNNPSAGENIYRLRINYPSAYAYSNNVKLNGEAGSLIIYPNPVDKELHIILHTLHPTDYKVELFNSNGQLIFTDQIKNVLSTEANYHRNSSITSGIYLLIVTDTNTGAKEIQKILFQ